MYVFNNTEVKVSHMGNDNLKSSVLTSLVLNYKYVNIEQKGTCTSVTDSASG